MASRANFILQAPFEPAGDQPKAISELMAGLDRDDRFQALLGVPSMATDMPAIPLALAPPGSLTPDRSRSMFCVLILFPAPRPEMARCTWDHAVGS